MPGGKEDGSLFSPMILPRKRGGRFVTEARKARDLKRSSGSRSRWTGISCLGKRKEPTRSSSEGRDRHGRLELILDWEGRGEGEGGEEAVEEVGGEEALSR